MPAQTASKALRRGEARTVNTTTTHVAVRLLGQGGLRFAFPGATVYIDPYLSHSVESRDSPDLIRLLPIPMEPGEVFDADWILISHDHLDHCDPDTLPEMAAASPQARFIGPPPVLELLLAWGLDRDRLQIAAEAWTLLAPGLKVHAVPAAHPKLARDAHGHPLAVGFVLEAGSKRFYVAGDTSATAAVIDSAAALGPFIAAFLPCNEDNYFRRRQGIIGNMSVREAILLADAVQARTMVPLHGDMFATNAVSAEEILIVHRQLHSSCDLALNPSSFSID